MTTDRPVPPRRSLTGWRSVTDRRWRTGPPVQKTTDSQEAAKGMWVRYRRGHVTWRIGNLKSGKSYGSVLMITDAGRYIEGHLSRLVPISS